MKWLGITALAFTITVILSLSLFAIFNTPVDVTKRIDNSNVEFTDITFDHHERGEIDGQIKALLNNPQVCKTAQDCIQRSYGCPFGCSSLINSTNHEQILTLKRARALTTGFNCMYRCGAQPKGSPACIDNFCTLVETIDGKSNIRKFLSKHNKN